MTSLPVVALAGATGRTGKTITKALLSPQFRPKFKDIVLLSRSKSTPQLDTWAAEGATIRTYTQDTLKEALQGVNIVINVINHAQDFKDALLQAATATHSVSLYFPSEFGVDHGDGTDSDFNHPEWDRKKAHLAQAKASFAPNVKICRVFPGLMTELSIGPWFGLDTANKRYEAVGSADAPNSFTSLDDIGRAVAKLASLPLDSIPEEARISGDAMSVREIAGVIGKAGGVDIQVVETDLEEFKREAMGAEEPSPALYLRFLMGMGKINFGKKNANDLVNAGESEWKWKTMKDYAEETKGRPWLD